MRQDTSANAFFTDLQDNLKDMMTAMPVAPLALQTILEMQRKNFQAITEVNQRVLQGWQTLAQRQTEMVSQLVQDNSGLAREALQDGAPQDKLSKPADMFKNYCEKSLAHSQELGEIVRRCTMDAAELLNRRVSASLSEIKSTTDNG